MKLGIDMALRTFVLGTLLVASASAFAQLTATAQVSVSNIRYELVDLNPEDDIAPQLTWLDASTRSTAWVETQRGYYLGGSPRYGSESLKTQEGPSFDAVTAISGPGIDVNTSADTLNISAQIPGGSYVVANAYHAGFFTLTPDTAVTFSAQYDAHLTVSVPPGASAASGYLDAHDYRVSSGADLYVLREEYGWNGLCCKTLSSLGASFSSQTSDQATTQPLSRTFTNFDDPDQRFGVAIYASLVARTAEAVVLTAIPLPVPEPTSWAMMGLGLLGLTGLRQRARRA